jgi:hypothetical protein
MKQFLGQAILVVILACASSALVGAMTGWIDLGNLTTAHTRQSVSNAISATPLPEQKPSEPIPTIAGPVAAAAKPSTIAQNTPAQEVTAPVAKASQQAILETGYDQLSGLGKEAAGYGLYSYGVLTAASPRSAAFLGEIFKFIPSIDDNAAARGQVNIFYIPTKSGKVADLAALVEASRDDQTKMAGRYSEAMYDYKMAKAILNHVCNPPAKTMKGLCREAMTEGPYILTYAKPASGLEPVPPPFLFVDLSNINPRAFPEFISTFKAVVKQDDMTDDAKLHSLRLKVLNLVLTAADWIPRVKGAVVDIVHAAEPLPEGQTSR